MTDYELMKAINEIADRLYALKIDLNVIHENIEDCCDKIREVYANVGYSRWTEKDVEFVKAMKKLYPDTFLAQRSSDGKDVVLFDDEGTILLEMYGNPFCFPRLEPGESVEVDTVIGGGDNGNESQTVG